MLQHSSKQEQPPSLSSRTLTTFDDRNSAMSGCVTVDEEDPFALQKRAYIRAILVSLAVLLLTFGITYYYCRSPASAESDITNKEVNSKSYPNENQTDIEAYTVKSTVGEISRRKNRGYEDDKTELENKRSSNAITEIFKKSVEKSPEAGSEIKKPLKKVKKSHEYIPLGAACRIPNISVTNESIRKYVKKFNPVRCSPYAPFTETYASGDNYKIRILPDNVPVHILNDASKLRCCYSIITRPEMSAPATQHDDHNRFKISSPPICFDNVATLPQTAEFVYVECKTAVDNREDSSNLSDENKIIYKNVHAVVRVKSQYGSKSRIKNVIINKNDDKPNVLIVDIGSTSRLGLKRSMPLTAKYLTDTAGWYELVGYTKVADDSFQNLVTLLTGKNQDQLMQTCWKSPFNSFDDCPFIWNDYKNESYLTAFVEDQAQKSPFNHMKYGFFRQPTDYYPRPFVVAAERLLLKDHHAAGLKYCLGPRPAFEHVLNYASDFVKINRDKRYFGFFRMDTFSSEDIIERPTYADERIRRFFVELDDYLNRTFIVFLSDHGFRHGPMRQTFVGWLEERTPFAYVRVPSYFRHRYPRKHRNLLINRNRLTSTYDLHLTLRDILGDFKEPDDVDNNNNNNNSGNVVACSRCSSIFDPIDWDRSCEQAGISPHWCVCDPNLVNLAVDSILIKSMVRYVTNDINQLLRLNNAEHHFKKLNTRCALLTVKKILSARLKKPRVPPSRNEYVVVFKTDPNNAIYEATVQHDGENFTLTDTVSRLNSYSSENRCVTNTEMLKYCMCITTYERS